MLHSYHCSSVLTTAVTQVKTQVTEIEEQQSETDNLARGPKYVGYETRLRRRSVSITYVQHQSVNINVAYIDALR